MNPASSPDFIPDSATPDFIPDGQADKFFGGNQAAPGQTDLLAGHPFWNYLLGQAGNTMKDIGQGVTSGGTLNSASQQEQSAKALEDKAYATEDMAKRKSLLQQANQYRAGVSDIAQNTAQNFSPDVEQNPLWRALKAATQIGTTAEAVSGPLSFLTGKAGIPNPTVAEFPDKLANMPLLGESGKLINSPGIKNALINHLLHGGAGGAIYGIGQQGKDFSLGKEGLYAGTGAAAETLLSALSSGMASYKGANKAIEKGAAEGGSTHWDDLEEKIRKQVTKEMGDNAETKQALDKFIASKTPAAEGMIPENPSGIPLESNAVPEFDPNGPYNGPLMNPTPYDAHAQDIINPAEQSSTDLLTTRRDIDNSLPQNFFQKMQRAGSADDRVAGIARRVVSQNLHELAPGTVTPDKLYSFYKKFGDIPTWAQRLGGSFVTDKLFGKRLPGAQGELVDILGGILAGRL